ncbi:MAG TPA: transcriptional regulator BetI [Aestuariivirgaceae bacterium]|jgi:TetR/AcrR family transcriptional repressor of bet genes
MKLISAQQVRRAELQKAAYEVACKYGFHAITLQQIADHAGTSKGIVHHYFSSKKDLVEHAVRYAHLVYRTSVVTRLKTAHTPSERLWSIIDASFSEEQFRPEICRLWLTIFDELPYDKNLARLVAILDRRSISLTVSAIKHLVELSEAEEKAFSLMALMDGFWILSAFDPAITSRAALSYIVDYIRRNIPRFDMSVVKFPN